MKILVTGGAGFIGSHLCEKLLSEGFDVVSIDNLDPFYDPAIKKSNLRSIQSHTRGKHFKDIRLDILDAAKLTKTLKVFKPDAVIHLAALAGVRPSIERPADYARVNLEGLFNLLEGCREAGVEKLVFGSSSSIYGNQKKAPFAESDPPSLPISPYAATKKGGEILCEFYSKSHRMQIAALRFFTAYGPRQRPDLAIHKFTRLMMEDKTIPFYGDGSMKRDYTYVEDIVSGIMAALRWTLKSKKTKGVFEVFNLGESRSIALKSMVKTLEKACGKKAKLQRLPQPSGDVDRTDADIRKAKKVLGYRPLTDFEKGIDEFVAWYKTKKQVGGAQ